MLFCARSTVICLRAVFMRLRCFVPLLTPYLHFGGSPCGWILRSVRFQGSWRGAPIGSVDVSISCSSSGAMRASCSSEGDQILYSWTLNGGPLVDGNSSIDLDNVTDGTISCSVKNHVSHGQKTVPVKPCSVLQISLIALGCVALILILVFITVYHIYKKKQVKSTPAAAGSVDVIYTDVSHKKKSEMKKTESLPAADVEYVEIQPQKKRKVRKEKEDDVQYGEVTLTLNRSSAHPRPQEECIYSPVHRC